MAFAKSSRVGGCALKAVLMEKKLEMLQGMMEGLIESSKMKNHYYLLTDGACLFARL